MRSEALAALIRIAPFVVVLGVVWLRVHQNKLRPADLSLNRPVNWGAAITWWAAFLTYILVVEALLHGAGLLELGGFTHKGLPGALRIAGMVLLAPVAEEILFRGILLNWLTKTLGHFHFAALLQAALFVALHNFAWQGGLQGAVAVAQSTVDALLYAYARQRTGSLWTPIAMHATGNSIAVVEMLA